MKRKIKVFDFHEITESAVKNAEKFCWRGYRTLTCCPICLKELLSIEETRIITEAFAAQNFKRLEEFTAAHDIGLLILVPSTHETAELLNYRLILAPVCSRHSQIDARIIEHNVIMVSRFGEIVKGDSSPKKSNMSVEEK